AFGLPFFAAGILMALTVTGLAHIKVEHPNRWTPLALAAMSLVFTVVGGLMVFGRRWTTIDVTRGTLVRQYGLLLPFKTQQWLLSDFNAVVVTHDPGDSDTAQTFPIRLRHRVAAANDVELDRPPAFATAYQQAEYLSGQLRVELVDTTTDHETVTAPGKAGLSLRERALQPGAGQSGCPRAGDSPDLGPAAPPKMRCTVTVTPGETTVVIPSGGSWVSTGFGFIVPLFIVVI